ncbi:MAG: DUF2752 domain-containing protein [Candidatus Zhuqueibacterota bacterium]
MMNQQVKLAIVIVWLILSAIILFIVTAPFLISAGEIYALTPTCQWKTKYNKDCLFCGLTTGFIAISRGDFTAAYAGNRLSIPLYAAFIVNEIVCLAYFVRQVGRRSVRERFTLPRA